MQSYLYGLKLYAIKALQHVEDMNVRDMNAVADFSKLHLNALLSIKRVNRQPHSKSPLHVFNKTRVYKKMRRKWKNS